MKKLIVFLLAAALLCSALTGCKGNGNNGNHDSGAAAGDSNNGGSGDNGGNNGGSGGSGNGSNSGNTGSAGYDGPKVDLLVDDLSAYIELDPASYKGYTVTVDKRKQTVLAENEIIQALYKHKSQEPVEGDGIISVGDSVSIFYKGYYMNGENKVYFSGGSNIGSSAYALGIGSGGFIPGFEYNMIGKNPADYSDDNPMIIETYFPEDYKSAELAGKTAFFEVTVEIKDGKYNITEYTVPEFTDEFITEKLKVSAEALATYEGESLVDKYRAYCYEANLDLESLKNEAFWASVTSAAVIKEYPESLMWESAESLKARIKSQYSNSYYSMIYTLDQYICLVLGYNADDDPNEALRAAAKDYVKEDLIIFHIMNLESLKPAVDEYEAALDAYLEIAFGDSIDPDGALSESEYKAKFNERKAQIIEYYGADYVERVVCSDLVITFVLGSANVVEING